MVLTSRVAQGTQHHGGGVVHRCWQEGFEDDPEATLGAVSGWAGQLGMTWKSVGACGGQAQPWAAAPLGLGRGRRWVRRRTGCPLTSSTALGLAELEGRFLFPASVGKLLSFKAGLPAEASRRKNCEVCMA